MKKPWSSWLGLAAGVFLLAAPAYTAVEIQTGLLDLSFLPPTGLISIDAKVVTGSVFYGKDIVGSITVRGINLDLARVEVVFTTVKNPTDKDWASLEVPLGAPLGAQEVTTAFRIPRAKQNFRDGASGGIVQYYLRGTLGVSQDIFDDNGQPFQILFIHQQVKLVNPKQPQAKSFDPHYFDGKTTVVLPAAWITQNGFTKIQQEDHQLAPAGPNGLKPVVGTYFTFSLLNLPPEPPMVDLTITYPAEADGRAGDERADPKNLSLRWWDGYTWRPLRAKLDSTLHTLTAKTTHWGKFAIFASGAMDAPSYRPADRIITPNGDNHHDFAQFGLLPDEVIHIFDIRGRRVRTISGQTEPKWDGRDDNGEIVESGVYIYQFVVKDGEQDKGERVSGVIAVAK